MAGSEHVDHDTAWPRGRSRDGGIDEIPLPRGPGRLWLCGKHAIGPDPEKVLTRTGATVVVCLVEEHELTHRYDDYVVWLRANNAGQARWWPIPDLHAPPVARAEEMVGELWALLDGGDGVVVHCGAGFGRAGTLAAAVLVADGAGVDEAVATVAAHRPMAGPEVGPQRHLLEALAAGFPRR